MFCYLFGELTPLSKIYSDYDIPVIIQHNQPLIKLSDDNYLSIRFIDIESDSSRMKTGNTYETIINIITLSPDAFAFYQKKDFISLFPKEHLYEIGDTKKVFATFQILDYLIDNTTNINYYHYNRLLKQWHK